MDHGASPENQELLPINKPSIVAFQSLIDTFANARQLRHAASHKKCLVTLLLDSSICAAF